ncbi:MAG TPA: hypothetical protein DEH78_16495 [Solibacterales bacterium]|nr:hypothetical protein [Bryobacterales bacterium]
MPADLDHRLTFLEASQNSDGGWGYFPGKQSWLEPTVYALLALHQAEPDAPACARAWKLLASWQRPDGGWRPCATVDRSSWVTALAVLALAGRNDFGQPLRRGVSWLLQSEGVPLPWMTRLLARIQPLPIEMDHRLLGWPYFPGSTSWVEPTSLTMLALKKVRRQHASRMLNRRVETGEKLLLDRRCSDGGWNYGNRRVLGQDMESFPEMTALALIALQDRIGSVDVDGEPDVRLSALGRAWMGIASSLYGWKRREETPAAAPQHDLMVSALEALAISGGMPFRLEAHT